MKDNKSTTIALSQIATLEQALDEAPARNATEVGKGKAIGLLAPKLYALRAKGYTWRDVAAWLTDHDVAVTPAALQRYLREGKIAAAKRDKVDAKTRREGVPREVAPGTATVDSNAAPSQPRPSNATPSAQTPKAGAAATARPAYAPGKFIPRPDTENI
jgi:hypothetical protein